MFSLRHLFFVAAYKGRGECEHQERFWRNTVALRSVSWPSDLGAGISCRCLRFILESSCAWCQILLVNEVDINSVTKNGETPLHLASRKGRLQIVKVTHRNQQ